MYAALVINIEAPLEGTFHYEIPADLQTSLEIGHLVEVEFGRRLAQGIVVSVDEKSPVEETKPIISLIDKEAVVRPWQIELASWMSRFYLAPLNACLRIMLPPGLTRWSDSTFSINPYWNGAGRLTETQELLLQLLGEKGDMRGRQIGRSLPKDAKWRNSANQLVKRGILLRGSILDPPRVKPRTIRTAKLIAAPQQILDAAILLGRKNNLSKIIFWLLKWHDPLPTVSLLMEETGATLAQLLDLEERGIISRDPADPVIIVTDKGAAVADNSSIPEQTKTLINRLPVKKSTIKDEISLQDAITNNLVEAVDQPPTISLAVSRDTALSSIFQLHYAGKYQAVLAILGRQAGPLSLTQIYKETGISLNQLKKLEKLDLIQLGEQEVWRDPLADRDFVPDQPPDLTIDQSAVWEKIKSSMAQRSIGAAGIDKKRPLPFLLHGVTGSGKTEIYLRAVEYALEQGLKAVILVPEIALTPQTVNRFAARFPEQVAVLHSRLTDGERFDTWRRAREGKFNIIIGPRSALFTILEPIGVIVIDEEHDHSYKQTPPVPPPYYHARDVALKLGQIVNAAVILGSATPDLVVYHQAQSGRYELLEMPKRIMGHRHRIEGQASRLERGSSYHHISDGPEDALSIPLPPVQLVDLRQELRAGNRTIFSRALTKAMDDTLEKKEQAILFLNRRGTATFIICRDCGLVVKCPRCEMPLTYHRPGGMLECHHCGRKERPNENCTRCGSHRIKYFGLGTERVEELVRQRWPDSRIVRWDSDTTGEKGSHEKILSSFINHEADILVGTQMIAKGLDLPLVTLVGVISADVSLGLPDYRIGERTFQILAQVAGRAGRGILGGRVIFQTYQADHYAIQAAAHHDFTAFYLHEIRFRTQHGLPPFRRMAKLILVDPIDQRAEHDARELARALEIRKRELELTNTDLVGPVPPFFNRVDGRYRWQLIIRSPDPARLLKGFKLPPRWILELDPVSTL